MTNLKALKNFTLEELRQEFISNGIPAFRAVQVFHWLYQKNVYSFEEMRNIPASLKQQLALTYSLANFSADQHLISADGTHKLLLTLQDGERVETVMIPAQKRTTVCVSTQVGCKLACGMCASGLKKFVRNLSPAEIVDQIVYVQAKTGTKVSHVVFMGMGEPFDNYDNVMKAVNIINHYEGLGIAARRITISTAGIVPGIKMLSVFPLQVNLSISLHATEDGQRSRIMPVNKKYPLESVLAAAEEYFRKTKRIITLEYALLKGVNDSLPDAHRLATICHRLKSKVNLLPFNPYSHLPYEAASLGKMKQFKNLLAGMKVPVTVRQSRGADIAAACGQLVGRWPKEEDKKTI